MGMGGKFKALLPQSTGKGLQKWLIIIPSKKEEATKNRKYVLCCFKIFSTPLSNEEGEGVTNLLGLKQETYYLVNVLFS